MARVKKAVWIDLDVHRILSVYCFTLGLSRNEVAEQAIRELLMAKLKKKEGETNEMDVRGNREASRQDASGFRAQGLLSTEIRA